MAFAPLVWLPGASNMWIFGKALAVAVAVLLGVLAGGRGGVPRPLLTVGAVGLVVLVVTALATDHPVAALVGRAPRYEGLPLLALYAAALWLGTTVAAGTAARRSLPDAVAAATMALGLATLADVLGHDPLRLSAVRGGSLLGNATDQGLVAMMATALLLGPAWSRRDPLLALGAASGAFVVAASGSRAALIGTVAAAVVLVALRGRRLALVAVLAPLAVVGLALLAPLTRARFTDSFSIEARLQIWGMTVRLLRDHLLLGVGPSGYADVIGRYETLAWAHGAGRGDAILNSPHSWPLQLAADAGLPGLLLAVALAAVVLTVGRRAARGEGADDLTPGLLAAVLAFGVGLLVNFTIVGSTAPAAFLLGVLVAPPGRAATGPARTAASVLPGTLPRAAHRAAAALALAAVVATAAASAAEIAFTRGVRLTLQGHPEAGARSLAWASRLRPLDHDIDTLASLALVRSAAPPAQRAARWHAERSQRATPGTYRSAMALAIGDTTAGREASAIARLDVLVEEHPFRSLPLVQRAVAQIRSGHRDAARTDLLRARRLAPGNPELPGLLAQAGTGPAAARGRIVP